MGKKITPLIVFLVGMLIVLVVLWWMRPSWKSVHQEWNNLTFSAKQARLTNPLGQTILSRAWSFDLKDMQILPKDPRWPTLDWISGQASWLHREHVLQLRNWTSSSATLHADMLFTPQNKYPQRVHIWGNADPDQLRQALATWKALPINSNLDTRFEYDLTYEKGILFIQVNGKPFFKATWSLSEGANQNNAVL